MRTLRLRYFLSIVLLLEASNCSPSRSSKGASEEPTLLEVAPLDEGLGSVGGGGQRDWGEQAVGVGRARLEPLLGTAEGTADGADGADVADLAWLATEPEGFL
mmetsp:Transcript_35316/g.75260  ORF Transcript_35316/g.75260 Transcript_35316/m.75260 type:complete len:103 (-) Transcript_35316:344-652(-)